MALKDQLKNVSSGAASGGVAKSTLSGSSTGGAGAVLKKVASKMDSGAAAGGTGSFVNKVAQKLSGTTVYDSKDAPLGSATDMAKRKSANQAPVSKTFPVAQKMK